jgi:small G protein signaling modulator 3
VWDVLLVDGFDVLFRLALAILRIAEDELLRCDSMPAVYVALESLPTRMWPADRLLQVEAELRATVQPAELKKRREMHVKELESILS